MPRKLYRPEEIVAKLRKADVRPSRRRRCVAAVCEGLAISQRRACRAMGQHRSTQRHQVQLRSDEDALTAAVVALAGRFGHYGYKRITGLLQMAGWEVNAKRVQRIWRAEGLKVPAKQPKRGRLWLADGSCIRLRPQHRNHVRAYLRLRLRAHPRRAHAAPAHRGR